MKTTNYAGAAMMALVAILAFVGVTPVIVGLLALSSAAVVLSGQFARGGVR
ncbi:hypothetical protein [Microbacterium sp. PA5]|uniref:hypothetical protein n=1 Tax=Microbacterium sp. PA5 TaxID=3416654 RepID=UPI003CE8DDAC